MSGIREFPQEPISDEKIAEIRAGFDKYTGWPLEDLAGYGVIDRADALSLLARLDKAEAENEVLRAIEDADRLPMTHPIFAMPASFRPFKWAKLVKKLHARLDKAEEALRFYADMARYQGANNRRTGPDPYAPEPNFSYLWDVTRDGGQIARAALSTMPVGSGQILADANTNNPTPPKAGSQ